MDLDLELEIAAAMARRARGTAGRSAQWAEANANLPSARVAQQQGIDQIGEDRMTLAGLPRGMGTLTKFAQGVPFVGEWLDEAADHVGRFTGNPEAGDQMRAVQGAMDRQHPIASTAAYLGGAVAGAIPLTAAAGPSIAAAAAPTRVGRIAQGVGIGVLAGGSEGAVSGAGRGEAGGRMQTAVTDGAIGAGVGGIVGGAAPALGEGAAAVFRRLKGSNNAAVSRALGVSDDAARVIRSAIQNDDFSAAEAALRRAGGGAMLADASPSTRQLLDTSVVAGGRASRIAGEAVQSRAAQASREMSTVLDDVLGPVQGRQGISRDIRQGTAEARGSAYDAAYAQPIDYSGQRGRALESLGGRVPQSAVNRANDLMRTEGVESAQIMARIGDDGRVVFEQMPDVRQWDYIARALGDVADSADGAGRLGGTTQAGGAARNLQRAIRSTLRREVPQYGVALDTAADAISRRQSAELGYNLLRPATTREAVIEGMAGAGRAQRDAARQGIRSYIDDTLANIGRVASDPNVDARELQRLTNTLTSRASREKLTEVLGTRSASRLYRELDQSIVTLELRAAIARNSATAVRQRSMQDVADITSPSWLEHLAQGEPVQMTKRLVSVMTGNTPEARAIRQQGIFDEIASALTQARGAQAESALRIVGRAARGQQITEGQARTVSRALTASSALGGYQAGTQYLQRR